MGRKIIEDFGNPVIVALLKRYEAEAQHDGRDGRHYACILRSDGNLLTHHPRSPSLAPEQLMWAQDVLKFLNRELHHDGAWTVVFTDPKPIPLDNGQVLYLREHAEYGRYVLLWLDADGDVRIPIEWVGAEADRGFATWVDVLLAGMVPVANAAEHAFHNWQEAMRALDARPSERFKKAAGERAPSAQR